MFLKRFTPAKIHEMRFTRQAELSIELLVLCARNSGGQAVTTREAAEATGTTKDHAAQIVSDLIHHGFLVGTRGRGGGIRLACEPDAINVGSRVSTILLKQQKRIIQGLPSGICCKQHSDHLLLLLMILQ